MHARMGTHTLQPYIRICTLLQKLFTPYLRLPWVGQKCENQLQVGRGIPR